MVEAKVAITVLRDDPRIRLDPHLLQNLVGIGRLDRFNVSLGGPAPITPANLMHPVIKIAELQFVPQIGLFLKHGENRLAEVAAMPDPFHGEHPPRLEHCRPETGVIDPFRVLEKHGIRDVVAGHGN